MMNNEEFKEKRTKALIEVILRQTDMKYEEAEESLKRNDYDIIKVLREYMSPSLINNKTTENSEKKTINQMIYKEIRQTMDKASLSFLRKQEFQRQLEDRRQYLLNQYQEQLELQRQNNINNMNNMDKLD